jgi:hypothetical protein
MQGLIFLCFVFQQHTSCSSSALFYAELCQHTNKSTKQHYQCKSTSQHNKSDQHSIGVDIIPIQRCQWKQARRFLPNTFNSFYSYWNSNLQYFEASGTIEEIAAPSALEKVSAATLKQSSGDMEISVAAPESLVTTEVQIMSATETMTSVSTLQQTGNGATATTSADLMMIPTTLVMTISSSMTSTTTATTTTTTTTTTTVNN